MEMTLPSDSDDQHRDLDDHVDQSKDEISFEFNRLQLGSGDKSDSQQVLKDSEVQDDDDDDDDEEDEDDDDDFTFMYVGDNDSTVAAEFENGEIRPVFPLFDQKLLLGSDYDVDGGNRLPIRPPVDKVFFESAHRSPSSTASETVGVAAGPYCSWSNESAAGTPELTKKSNSTGFSKLWRFRDKVSRSNSDGRDAFVFLNNSDRTTPSASTASTPAAAGEGSSVTVNGAGGGKAKVVKKGSKAKSATASAHEVYLRNRGGKTEDRRRSYLPYRPELMGFFTNVNGGLSRNVHPF